MGASPDITWRFVPLHTPVVHRRCKRCEGTRTFVSSGKFRINAQQRRLDVWLIYKCRVCKETWNSAILSRVAPEDIDRDLYDKFLANDEETATRYAFDYEVLRRNDAEFDPKIEYRVEGDAIGDRRGEVSIRIEPGPIHSVRLDNILKKQLGVSGRRVEELHARGAIRVLTEHAKLEKRIKRPVELIVDLDALREVKVDLEN